MAASLFRLIKILWKLLNCLPFHYVALIMVSLYYVINKIQIPTSWWPERWLQTSVRLTCQQLLFPSWTVGLPVHVVINVSLCTPVLWAMWQPSWWTMVSSSPSHSNRNQSVWFMLYSFACFLCWVLASLPFRAASLPGPWVLCWALTHPGPPILLQH